VNKLTRRRHDNSICATGLLNHASRYCYVASMTSRARRCPESRPSGPHHSADRQPYPRKSPSTIDTCPSWPASCEEEPAGWGPRWNGAFDAIDKRGLSLFSSRSRGGESVVYSYPGPTQPALAIPPPLIRSYLRLHRHRSHRHGRPSCSRRLIETARTRLTPDGRRGIVYSASMHASIPLQPQPNKHRPHVLAMPAFCASVGVNSGRWSTAVLDQRPLG